MVYPQPGTLIDADVAVAPLPGSPEEALYRESLDSFPGPVIVERNPYTALSRALAHPRPRFSRLIAGVDPGRECGLAVIGDGVVIGLVKVDCGRLADAIMGFQENYPAARTETYIGDGQGFPRAAASMELAGLSYTVVDERGTTRPPAYAGLFSLVKDRDLLAGLAIALKGAYGSGRLTPPLRGAGRL